MSRLKTFNCTVQDDHGWDYNAAFITVWSGRKVLQDDFATVDGIQDYEHDLSIGSLEYKAVFHQSESAKDQGKTSRPLINKNPTIHLDKDGNEIKELTDVLLFSVDLKHIDSEQIIASVDMSTDEKTVALIQYDIERRFA